MVTLRSIVTSLAGVALLTPSSLGHSLKRSPVTYISTIEDISIKAPSHRVHAFSHFDLTFTLHDGEQDVRLVLEPNHDILHDSFTVTYIGADGQLREAKPVGRTEHKVFKGFSYVHRGDSQDWSRAGTARITIHRDGDKPLFDGHFRIDGNNHHVQTAAKYVELRHDEDPQLHVSEGSQKDTLIVWRDSDINTWDKARLELKRDASGTNDSICDSGSLSFNTLLDDQMRQARDATSLWGLSTRTLFGRQSIDGTGAMGGDATPQDLAATIGSTTGCPTARKVALVGIATDCNYWKGFDTEEDLRKNVIGMVNQASEVYETTFQISLGIKNLTISEKECHGTPSDSSKWNVACGHNVNINDRLNRFSAWRGQFDDVNAYWTLLSTCNTDSAVGLAWRGQLCVKGGQANKDNETVASANFVVRTDTEWQVFAHETGHIFGAVHDCWDTTCPETSSSEVCCPLTKSTCNANGKYIMNPATGDGITAFSPCSIGNICSGLRGAVNGKCLTDNKNIKTFTGSQCGNGIVEEGEDCDCGGDTQCQNNACCDASTCKFKNGAVCDPANEDCCTDKCKFESSGTVCRASAGECDVQETCPGNAAKCPEDQHKQDGDSCGNDGQDLKCASGHCTSRDLQCQNMVSSLSSGNNTGSCRQESGCALTCTSPDGGDNTCTIYNQNFMDGTPCGAGGHCSDGDCKGSSTWKEIAQWIRNHLSIVIPIAVVVGLLILAAIVSCFTSSCRRKRRMRKLASSPPQMSSWPGQRGHAGYNRQWNDSGAPPTREGWDNMARSGGHSSQSPSPMPVPPPPSNWGHYDQTPEQPWVGRSRSNRWA